jgi:DNA primase
VIYLTEGVFDAVAIWQNTGFTAWARTNGAGAFPEHLVPQFKGKTVFIPVDNDRAGCKGALKIAKMLEGWAKVRLIELPRHCKDPGEFFGRGGTAKQFRELIKEEESQYSAFDHLYQ